MSSDARGALLRKLKFSFIAGLLLAFLPQLSFASGADDWSKFKIEIQDKTERQSAEGMGYMISGGVVLLGATIGYQNSSDALAKSAYSLSQSFSIAAIGYGNYLHTVGDDERDFFHIVENSNSLTLAQKSEILRNYRERKGANQAKARMIRIVSHSLIALTQFFNASQEEDEGVRSALYFFGGANAVAAIAISF